MPRLLPYLFVTLVFACDARLDSGAADSNLTSAVGDELTIEYDSFVYVPVDASDDDIRREIQRQVKSSLGALRERGIGVMDRDAHNNLGSSSWTRVELDVVDETGDIVDQVQRVTFRYQDRAIVERDRIPNAPIALSLLFGDYQANYGQLVPDCTDDDEPAADSLWYHYHPGRWACRWKIDAERGVIADAMAELSDPTSQIAAIDRDRLFVTTTATLTPVEDPPVVSPEYDRLWGFRGNTSRNLLVVYAFFGVDKDQSDPRDYGLREFLRFQRTLRQRFPDMRVTHTEPFAWLLSFDGADNVTWEDVENWIIDDVGFPPGADREHLQRQVVERFAERWIYWELPVTVSDGETTRNMTVQIRSYYGYEDGSHHIRQRAQWRYLEAFWHGDVFAYTGHSHFGHGPLAPFYYNAGNFPWRYQVMLVNSCLSFNYYDQDFIDIHPGGSENLDIVTNGLAAYWHGMGEASANYVASLIDGENKTWEQVVESMQIDLPWGVHGYDPLRVVNGELDNPDQPQLTVTH